MLTPLPAAVKSELGAMDPVLMLGGRVRLNCMLNTEAAPGSKLMGKFTAVPACPEAFPTVSVGAAHAEAAKTEERRAHPT
ncbi:MAG: hypothetical protein A2X40_08990 [Elusimicrobia bacterium GWC2_65_9]|nr:MAG: hypothetical protein A2X37_05690 [Elusimicrobia bacterium GWA2_66_18]OGR68800.1 MAG: hypothetical protein A2X40_08990 [Elusimicrobia bacterium GWC2_65_9]